MINKASLEQKIADVVACSLQYFDNVSSHLSLAEDHIKYPFVEFLERKLQCQEIDLEVNMKRFAYRRYDATFKYNDKRYISEFKYIRSDSIDAYETQRIFNDIVRLYYAIEEGADKALLLICGETDKYVSSLLGRAKVVDQQIPQVGGVERAVEESVFEKWLSFTYEGETVVENNEANEGFFNEYQKKYIDKHRNDEGRLPQEDYIQEIPKTIKIKTILRTKTIDKNKLPDIPFTVSVWEIQKIE